MLVIYMSCDHQMKHINRLYLQGAEVLYVRTDDTLEL
jgi:hypothetical protein